MLWHQTLATNHLNHIALIPGLASNAELLRPLASLLSRHAQITLIDLPGHGKSPAIKGDIANWIDALSSIIAKDSVIIGWSLGGLLAIKLAQALPCKQLILLATTPCFVATPDWRYGVDVARWQDFTQRIITDLHQGLQYFFRLQTRHKRWLSTLDAEITRYPITQQAMLAGLAILKQNDLRQTLCARTCPVHVILGKYDALINIALNDWYQTNNIPTTVLTCDHLVFGHRHLPAEILKIIGVRV